MMSGNVNREISALAAIKLDSFCVIYISFVEFGLLRSRHYV